MDSSLMDGELHLLASGTGEYWIRFGLEITFSVNVEECDVSNGGIAIRKEEAWFVFRHSRNFRICKVRKNLYVIT